MSRERRKNWSKKYSETKNLDLLIVQACLQYREAELDSHSRVFIINCFYLLYVQTHCTLPMSKLLFAVCLATVLPT